MAPTVSPPSAVFRELGIQIEENEDSTVTVHGKGLHGLSAPSDILDVGNSGTTTRLLSGILAGQPFESKLSGDESLNSRPMKRIIEPLTQMGAQYFQYPPQRTVHHCIFHRRSFHGIHYESHRWPPHRLNPAILLAGLYADGETSVTEPSSFPETIQN